MAKEKEPLPAAAPAEDKKRAIEADMGQIEKMYGKGSIMRLGDQNNLQVDVIPTGSLSLDVALGVGDAIFSGVGVAATIVDDVVSFAYAKKDKKDRENGKFAQVYKEIEYSSSGELRQNLQKYFKWDVFDTFGGRERPYVIFLDGYEKLVSLLRDGKLAEYEDNWISKPGEGLVNIPNTLWVIAGREKINWNKGILILKM